MGWSWVTNHTGMLRRPRLRATARLPWAPPRIRAPRAPDFVVPGCARMPLGGVFIPPPGSRPRHRRNRTRHAASRHAFARRCLASAVFDQALRELPRGEGGAGDETHQRAVARGGAGADEMEAGHARFEAGTELGRAVAAGDPVQQV